jgi:cupin 2 domain-containing protein
VASGLRRGTLAAPGDGPAVGEEVRPLVAARGVAVEEILSGRLEAPADYVQVEDEWVVLLAGRASLTVGGESIELRPGDWLYLPSGLPHTLVETAPGSSWLAVRIGPG